MSKIFSHRFRVRYAEIDQQAVVFNSRYLEYADIIVTEFFRACGIGPASEMSPEFHVVRALIEYHRPIRVDERIEGRLSIAHLGTSSVKMTICLHGIAETGADNLRAEIELVYVHVDLVRGTSSPLPRDLRKSFALYCTENEEKVDG